MMTPPSKMLTPWALLISMPAEPETTPALKMPPVKVGPAMLIAVLLERTSCALDQDAVARRLDAAAVDDPAGDRAREQGDAGFRRDRTGIDNTAHDARN